ncbi:MAG TPA: AAA family ATPase, partial [Candidatus Thermoplasmatota archaeon]
MADPGRALTLTIQERIMLHLESHTKGRDDYAVPRAVTQSGIADALAIRVAHASREVRKLVEGELADERDAAVEGSKRHQKAYFLTPAGAQAAAKLRAEIGPEAAAAIAAAARQPGRARAEGGPVHVLRDLPQLRYFFGRSQELAAARKLLEARGVLVVLGIAGIGKSTFGAKLQAELAPSRSTVWYQIHEYDTPASVLAPVARVLALLGRPKLELLIKRDAGLDLPQARDVLLADAEEQELAVFIDDPHLAPPEALQALRVLREVAAAQPEALKVIFLARTRPPIYDGRDVTLRRAVGELELYGLPPEDVGLLLGT